MNWSFQKLLRVKDGRYSEGDVQHGHERRRRDGRQAGDAHYRRRPQSGSTHRSFSLFFIRKKQNKKNRIRKIAGIEETCIREVNLTAIIILVWLRYKNNNKIINEWTIQPGHQIIKLQINLQTENTLS